MVRKIRSGKVIEVSSFRVASNVRPRKGRRRGATTRPKQDQNDRDCVKRLARVLNCNFSKGDLLLQPTWDDAALAGILDGGGDDLDAVKEKAEHALSLFLRRLGRELKKYGAELKAVWLTSDLNGDTGEVARIHHHIVVSKHGLRMDDGVLYVGDRPMDDIWGHGSVDWKPLQDQDDYSPLAAYLIRQVRRKPDAKKYSTSRGLAKPVLISERIVYNARELKAPKGAKVMHRAAYTPGEPQYIRYVEPVREKRGGRKRECSTP